MVAMKHCSLQTLLGVALASVASGMDCNNTKVQVGMSYSGTDYKSLPTKTMEACQKQCCEESSANCGAFTWTSFQPHDTANCSQGSACCSLKRPHSGTFQAMDNCTAGEVVPLPPSVMSPNLTEVGIIARDDSGALRDPSAMVQDPKTGLWHFWVVYIPHAKDTGGWGGFIQHWSAPSFAGPFTNKGVAMNHSTDPLAYDEKGMFSPSAIYDTEEDMWFLFYSGTGANHSNTSTCAQLVASSSSPEGPWTRLGLVAYPTGTAEGKWAEAWNARRLDSGRAMIVNGKRGYWTKGVMQKWTGQEGAYFPQDPSSFRPPYAEWSGNPIYRIDGTSGSYRPGHGYENCEFFMGPTGEIGKEKLLHVLCTSHGKGTEHQPHFVADPDALSWIYVDTLVLGALEPTPVYEGGMPGDKATVTHFIARKNDDDGRLVVALYKLDWVASGFNDAIAIV